MRNLYKRKKKCGISWGLEVYDFKEGLTLKLFEFLEAFSPDTEARILDENGNLIEENSIGKIKFRTVCLRNVRIAYPKESIIEVIAETVIKEDDNE